MPDKLVSRRSQRGPRRQSALSGTMNARGFRAVHYSELCIIRSCALPVHPSGPRHALLGHVACRLTRCWGEGVRLASQDKLGCRDR
jgi:hypothetical protein